MQAQTETGRLDRSDGPPLAWARTPGRGPTTVFLPGFRSDMTGAKAVALQAWCQAAGTACLRLDYAGHGASGGAFEDGTIGQWTADALALIDALTEGPLLLVGSSMGGWIALLLALARPHRIAGLIGVAAAPDFTQALMWAAMMPAERETLQRDGVLHIPSQYGDPTPVTLALIEDGRNHLLMDAPIAIHCPVRLLHGQQDPDVPGRHPSSGRPHRQHRRPDHPDQRRRPPPLTRHGPGSPPNAARRAPVVQTGVRWANPAKTTTIHAPPLLRGEPS